MEPKSILFPVDFSARCHAAAPHVKAMAKRFGANITLLNMVEDPILWLGGGAETNFVPESLLPQLITQAETAIAEFATTHFSGLPVTTLIEEGDPGLCVPEIARRRKHDLIMLPTHGRGFFRSALLGSVTTKVLHDASCPVWTAAHTETAPEGAHVDWHNIMCAVDLTDESIPLIRAAQEWGAGSNAKIRLVHAVPSAESGIERYLDREFDVFLKDAARKKIAEMQKQAGTNFDVCMEGGKVSQVVAHAAEHHNADLIVIGRGVLLEFAGGLRTDAYAIIRDAPCPVLSF